MRISCNPPVTRNWRGNCTSSLLLLVVVLCSSSCIVVTNGFVSVKAVSSKSPSPHSSLSYSTGTTATTMIRLPALLSSSNDHHHENDTEEKATSTISNNNRHRQQQQQQQQPSRPSSLQSRIGTTLLATTLLLGSTFTNLAPLLPTPAAFALEGGSKVVGTLKGSGLVFKDTLQIERFEDPKIKGVVLYISNFDRPLAEKLTSGTNFFNDPSSSSVACAKTTKDVLIADNIQKGPQGEEVFEESRSLLFKTLRVQRIYDTETNTVVYVSYNTRLDKSDDTNKSRFKSSLCAVNLNDQ